MVNIKINILRCTVSKISKPYYMFRPTITIVREVVIKGNRSYGELYYRCADIQLKYVLNKLHYKMSAT